MSTTRSKELPGWISPVITISLIGTYAFVAYLFNSAGVFILLLLSTAALMLLLLIVGSIVETMRLRRWHEVNTTVVSLTLSPSSYACMVTISDVDKARVSMILNNNDLITIAASDYVHDAVRVSYKTRDTNARPEYRNVRMTRPTGQVIEVTPVSNVSTLNN